MSKYKFIFEFKKNFIIFSILSLLNFLYYIIIKLEYYPTTYELFNSIFAVVVIINTFLLYVFGLLSCWNYKGLE